MVVEVLEVDVVAGVEPSTVVEVVDAGFSGVEVVTAG
jgi:hypothetical protein